MTKEIAEAQFTLSELLVVTVVAVLLSYLLSMYLFNRKSRDFGD